MVGSFAGHKQSVSKVLFNPQGKKILTCSEDSTCKIWDLEGNELQTLLGHEEEVFSAQFNYHGDIIITGSKDNSCIVWRDTLSKEEY